MPHILVNGKIIPSKALCISAHDRGFTLGHGLFETMLASRGVIPFLSDHWARLSTSAPLLGIPLSFDEVGLAKMIKQLLNKNQLTHARAALRLTVTDGISERGIVSTTHRSPTVVLTASHLPDNLTQSMSATIVNTRRNEYTFASRIKSISYLDNILAKKEALSQGFDEAFLLNSSSHLAEGSVSTVFVVKNNTVYTPPLTDGALPGVIRHVILNRLKLDGLILKEKTVHTGMLDDADEVFISNALMGVKPIHRLDEKTFAAPYSVATEISVALRTQYNYP